MRPSSEIEERRRAEQARLERDCRDADRNRLGQYATPPRLAADIAHAAQEHWPTGRPVRFLEPCVGSGAFFYAVASAFPAGQVERAVGFECDPQYAQVADTLWRSAGLSVRGEDFTRATPNESFNLLVTNPPYVRHHHLTPEVKRQLAERVATITGIRPSGLAGLYTYFPLLAQPWLADGALAAWLIPSEFLDVNYGSALKTFLLSQVDLLRVHRFNAADVQFADALVSSTVVVYRKATPSPQPVVFTQGHSIGTPSQHCMVDRDALVPSRKWGLLFDRARESDTQPNSNLTLGDLFTIRRGLATGRNDYFILSRDEARRRQLPECFLRPILPGPRLIPDAVIETDTDGFPRGLPQTVLVDCRLGEEQVRRQYPRLWAYYQEGERSGINRGYLTSRRTPWYSQEDRPPPPFLCPYMGRQKNGRGPFRFVWNKTAATAHNVYMLLYPKGPLARRLSAAPELYEAVFEALRRIDGGGIVSSGRVYGGGLHKVEPNELASVPAQPVASLLGRSLSTPTLFDALT